MNVDSIVLLSRYLKAFGAVFLIVSAIEILPEIFEGEVFQIIFHPIEYGPSTIELLGTIKHIIFGFIFLSLSNGLAKKEKWAFISSLIIFCANLFFNLFYLIFRFSQSLESLLSILGVLLNGYFLYLLMLGKETFPKESHPSFFTKPAFIVFIIGIGYIIFSPFLEEIIMFYHQRAVAPLIEEMIKEVTPFLKERYPYWEEIIKKILPDLN